jgi:hypothetical protein
MESYLRGRTTLLGALLLATIGTATAATPPHIINTDLEPLIRAAASSRTQFAVEIAYPVSTASSGSWTTANGLATWRYAVRIPTAVSMSFHAVHGQLPGTATLTVAGATTTFTYHGKDLHHSELWSRIQSGDTLEFSLSVPSPDKAHTLIEIGSFQAGYRSLGLGAQDHPYYRKLQQRATTSGTGVTCAQNYACAVTAANTAPGQATVGLVINGLYQCTGTLINNTSQDNTPYVLTARHCETGTPGGGNPGAAANVTVYWEATTPCNASLGSLYDPTVQTQAGATTVVEQQDAWLIRLDNSPIVSDAQFAGFDAAGDPVQGGYTIHHALGLDKQYTTWFSTALAVQDPSALGVQYVSNFLETVNATGNIGPGTSGSGLFNQNNLLVGSASLGRTNGNGGDGYESCPVPNPTAPNGTNGAADFTSLAAIWNSTADPTSTTALRTLKLILDPTNTGALTVGSTPAATMTFSASTYSVPVGGTVTLTWNAPGASQCTASGGATGDGWQGDFPAASSLAISESTASIDTYTLNCLAGARTIKSTLSVTWGQPQPQISFTGSIAAWTSTPATLRWVSNYSPCSITGGSLSASGLPSSGSITTTQNTTGSVTYQIQCGTGANYLTTSWSVDYVTPSLQLFANRTDLQLGQPLNLGWITAAQSCVPSGGAPNDGWTGTAFGNPLVPGNAGFNPNITTLGTYIYTLTCSSGSLSIQQSVTVVSENNPGYATLSVSPTAETFTNTLADTITLTFASNLYNCYASSDPVASIVSGNPRTPNIITARPLSPGTYTFTVTCDPWDTIIGQVTSAPVTVTVLSPPPPTATMSITPASVVAGQTFTVSWSTTNTQQCIGTGTPPPELIWQEVQALIPTSGTAAVISQTPGSYTFGISCQSIVPGGPATTAQATVTVTAGPKPPPTVTLTASPSSIQPGQTLTLTWSSTNATSCQTSGGGASSLTGWIQLNDPPSGTYTEPASKVGTYTYVISCSQGSQSAQVSATVTVGDPSATGGSGDGSNSGGTSGKGGGGAMSLIELLALATTLICLPGKRGSQILRQFRPRCRPCRPEYIPSSASGNRKAHKSGGPTLAETIPIKPPGEGEAYGTAFSICASTGNSYRSAGRGSNLRVVTEVTPIHVN